MGKSRLGVVVVEYLVLLLPVVEFLLVVILSLEVNFSEPAQEVIMNVKNNKIINLNGKLRNIKLFNGAK
ncbi:MAG TPA: hypothetical protein VFF33_10215 [Ignavibacteriaceae bacterium]|nr:hypothetical protein [Ignavibacteriaceae bacterium]